MATAEVGPPRSDSALVLGPGVAEAKSERDNPVLPSQEAGGAFLPSNVSVEFVDQTQLRNARPDRVLLGALSDPRLRVVKPIALDVTVEESHVVVSWADVDEFGTGETLSTAIDDLGGSLRELYHRLSESEKLGPDLAKVKRVLHEHIVARSR